MAGGLVDGKFGGVAADELRLLGGGGFGVVAADGLRFFGGGGLGVLPNNAFTSIKPFAVGAVTSE